MPGVGSYDICMQNLKLRGLDQFIIEFVKTGKPFLGICLGMQVLSSFGFEGRETKGLDLINGNVKEFSFDNSDLKVPHVGWNNVCFNMLSHPLVKGLKINSAYYFTHSYYFDVENENNIFASTFYGFDFPSSVLKENVYATQFHPEKSQDQGLKLLFNFLNWNP